MVWCVRARLSAGRVRKVNGCNISIDSGIGVVVAYPYKILFL